MKALLLARVSSHEQEEGQSIPSQVRRLQEYAERKRLTVDKIFKVTESSTKETRKQFNEIIELIRKSKESVALITDTVDRLQRSFRETPTLDELRKEGKLELHFLRESLIVNREANSAQLLQWDMYVLFASSYVRQLSDNVKRSKEQSVRNGEWITGAPFGYRNVTLPTGKKTIEVEFPEAIYVQKMFEMYVSGIHSFKTIAHEMTKLGVKNKNGNPFLPGRVHFILTNPFYYGTMKVKGELYHHKYPPLVTEELFQRAQDVMADHCKAPAHYAAKPILLRGMITCSHCGSTISGEIKKGKYVYYSCGNAKQICKKVWIREEEFLETLLHYMGTIELPDSLIAQVIQYLKEAFKREQSFYRQSQETLQRELAQVQNRLSRLTDEYLDGRIDKEIYQRKIEEYKAQQRAINTEMHKHIDADESCLITVKTVLDLAKRAKELFMSSKMAEKQQLLNFVFSNLKLEGKKLLVTLREPFLSLSAVAHQPMNLRV